MPDFVLKSLPPQFGRGFCERYRIEARKRLRPSSEGRHLQLRRGQSLEFRDFVEYSRGDDVRTIDWRASARYRGPNDLLVRNFTAEEALKLVISIDTRESMYYPQGHEKVQQAAWLTELLARIALYASDHVYLHRLFGRPTPPLELKGEPSQARLGPWLRAATRQPASEDLNLELLHQVIYPVSTWVILSDYYWEPDEAFARQLSAFIRQANEGWRWVIMMDLDSWPYERALLEQHRGGFAWRVRGPGLADEEQVDLDDRQVLNAVAQRIGAAHTQFCRQICRGFDSSWAWAPVQVGEPPDPEREFRQHFIEDRTLRRLFERSR